MTVQQPDQQQPLVKPRRTRKRLLWLILPVYFVLTAVIVIVLWQYAYNRADPAYTAAIEQLYDANAPAGESWYMPRWAPEGFMPLTLEYSFSLSLKLAVNDERPRLSFHQNSFALETDMDVQRRYTRRRKGIEYLYTEKHRDDSIFQDIIWLHEDTQMYVSYWNTKDNPISEDALFRMAYSVEPYTPKAKV